jgi:hypothetical protein
MDLINLKYKEERLSIKPPSKYELEKLRDAIEILILNNICCTPEYAVDLINKHPDICLNIFLYFLKKTINS